MIRSLLCLLFITWATPLFSQADQSVRINTRKPGAPFWPLIFRNDSITIIGQYKNYHHAAGDLFKVTGYDWISSKRVHHTAEIDSFGRFSLTFALPAESDIFLDDARLDAQTVGVPGETIYFEADLKDRSALTFRGENARLHTEIHQWFIDKRRRRLPDYTDSEWYNQFPTPAVLADTMLTVFRNNLRYLEAWERAHRPEARTMQYLRAHISYEAAMPLTQKLYHPFNGPKNIPDASYFRRIDSIIAINGPTGHLSQHFIVVHRDFRNHANDIARAWNQREDSVYAFLARHPREKELTALWTVARYLREGHPVKDDKIAALRQAVQDTLLANTFIRRNDALKQLMADEHLLADTRIVTQFPSLKSAEDILAHITAPYRGKVIYLDIWGTWCSPCIEMMQYMPDLKKAYAGKDVVFVYLAKQSPGELWKKTILEHKITGPTVAHYRLPDDVQDIFERKYRSTSYPCYLLIGKDGQVATTRAPWPNNASALHAAINKLL